MIDYEFRVITPAVIKVLKKKIKGEKILLKKIPLSFITKRNINRINRNYFLKNKRVSKIFYRGLPINNKKLYFDQENQIKETFNSSVMNFKKIKGGRIIQVPNPDFVKFSEFKKYVNAQKEIAGFELIASWHNKSVKDKKYFNFLKFISKKGLPLSLEVDYMFRNTQDKVSNFFDIINKFPKIKYWLPHLGCGAFLHWDKIILKCKFKPVLLSSTKNSKEWLNLFKMKQFKKIPIKFATDHPLNGNSSYAIYKNYINYLR